MIQWSKEMSRPAHILLVEDNRLDVELTLDAFREAHLGNTIHVARNGREALDYIFGEGEYTNREAYPMPDLVLLDLKLPGIDGHEVLRRIKATPCLKRLPVVILTSSEEEADRARCYESGANSYLVKPVSFEGFLKVVRQLGHYWLTLNVGPPGVCPPGKEPD
jgi:CheY-like chemotaxis protein